LEKESDLPEWLVGSYYVLVRALCDIDYLRQIRTGFWGRDQETRVDSRPLEWREDAPCVLAHFEFGLGQSVRYRSQLLAPEAVEELRRVQGQIDKLDPNRLNAVFRGGQPKEEGILTKLFGKREPRTEASMVQTSIVSGFPMGAYRGLDHRLVLLQEGSRLIAPVDPLSLRPRHLLTLKDLNDNFDGIPCSRPLHADGKLIEVLVDNSRQMGGEGYPKDLAEYRVIEIEPRDSSQRRVGRLLAKFWGPPVTVRSFAVTENYVIVPVAPWLCSHKTRDIGFGNSKWDDKGDTLFYVVSRREKRLVAVYRSEPAYLHSVISAQEHNEGMPELTVDVAAADNPRDTLDHLKLSQLREEVATERFIRPTLLRRYTLPKLGEEMARFDGAAGQLPAFPLAPFRLLSDFGVHQPVASSPSSERNIIWGLAVDREQRELPGTLPNAIVMCDTKDKGSSQQWHHRGAYAGPPCLVESPPLVESVNLRDPYMAVDPISLTSEKLLLSLVLDTARERSYLAVLDATDLRERARFMIPHLLSIPLTSGTFLFANIPFA